VKTAPLYRQALVGVWLDLEPVYDAVKAGECVHGRVASMGCYLCCMGCDMDMHRCHFCGDALRHDGSPYDLEPGEPNPCYLPEVTEIPVSVIRARPIYDEVCARHPNAAIALLNARFDAALLAAQVNALNKRIQEGFRRIDEIRAEMRWDGPILGGVTKT
jgi:hypothetical protein